MLRADAAVYGGYSAGVCVLIPSLRGLEIVDDPEAVTQVYGDRPIWDGLGVLDHAIVPHFDSPDHPESEACGRVAAHYRATGVPHRTLRDGEVLVIDGHDVAICG
jgi:dipeptidase E